MKNILIVGGAGYIGSHFVKAIQSKNWKAIVIDDFSTGHHKAITGDVIIEQGNLGNTELLDKIFQQYEIDAVAHFAAFTEVGKSVQQPLEFYQNNVSNTIGLLQAIHKYNIQYLIFSSTAAVYGEPQYLPIDEQHPLVPINPYGRSKYYVENIIQDYANTQKLHYCIFRYFNAAGSDPEGKIGEWHNPETHLIPVILRSITQQQSKTFAIFGDDYNTKDGTCIRDYIHVHDLAAAHILGLEYLLAGGDSNIFNLGSGHGYSVREILEMAKQVTQTDIPYTVEGRREGDPASLIACSQKAKEILKWQPKYDCLDSIIRHAWNWLSQNPNGYSK